MAGYVNGKPGGGKAVANEQSIVNKLYEMIGVKHKAYYICWRYCPQALPNKNVKTFEDLCNTYSYFTSTMTEEFCQTWLTEQQCQNAIKWLLKRLHQSKMIELYNTYYEKAKDDTAAFRAFVEFSDRFFTNEKESELLSILKGVDLSEDEAEIKEE